MHTRRLVQSIATGALALLPMLYQDSALAQVVTLDLVTGQADVTGERADMGLRAGCDLRTSRPPMLQIAGRGGYLIGDPDIGTSHLLPDAERVSWILLLEPAIVVGFSRSGDAVEPYASVTAGYDATSGAELWRREEVTSYATNVTDDLLVVSTNPGVAMVEASSGEIVSSAAVPGLLVRVCRDPAGSDIAFTDLATVAFDSVTHEIAWTFDQRAYDVIDLGDGRAVLMTLSDTRQIEAVVLDVHSGAELARHRLKELVIREDDFTVTVNRFNDDKVRIDFVSWVE